MRELQLDDRDRQILNELQNDGRLSNADLAERVNLSPSACLRRVNLLLESGIVAGTHLVLDEKVAGFAGTAYVFLTLAEQGAEIFQAFETRVRAVPQIQECYLVAGQTDYMIRVVFADMADLERLHAEVISRLPGVVQIRSALALRTVKRTTKLPI
ncbi:Lrp/AsnC family transcriptional regulator [Methyloraptor flagellatus]|jgi:DNA-binding Lrp family transcriptional regulator|uniref:Lrp/AsnC family transcriptional regulator n=1 Tax=Methyloraptor flagellatus TaxID=3162530 RepID=A0AAU7X5E9_9HYPH